MARTPPLSGQRELLHRVSESLGYTLCCKDKEALTQIFLCSLLILPVVQRAQGGPQVGTVVLRLHVCSVRTLTFCLVALQNTQDTVWSPVSLG